MKIQEKEFEINTNVRYGLLKEFQSGEMSSEHTDEFIMDVLEPTPSQEFLDEELRYLDVMDIFAGFREKMEKQQAEIRKKYSQ